MDKELSKRIRLTRYLMVIGIVVLHIPPYQSLAELGLAPFEFIKAFFSHAVFRTTVPMLTVMSGYLLFSSKLVAEPLKLWLKKAQSLLLPLILWNIPVVLAIFIIQRYQLSGHEFSVQLYPAETRHWLNALTGLLDTPANYPLNFLRDLFALCLLAPLFRLLLNYAPYAGFALIALIYFYNLDGPFVLRNSMFISFYLGALIATQRLDIRYLDRFALPLLLLFVLFCVCIVVFDINNREPLRLLAPFMIWPVMSLLVNLRPVLWLNRFADSSFLTFLAHGPLLLLCWLAYSTLLPSAPYPLFWFLAPVFTVVLCAWLHPLLTRFFPRTASLLLGGRN